MASLDDLAGRIAQLLADQRRSILATVGHELRTPLTSIRGYLETLLEGDFDPLTARQFLETARREALRLGRLVDGMMGVSLLDLSTAANRASCNVVEQIRATLEMLSPTAEARHVTIRTRMPDALHAQVDGDACVHAVANLIGNAIKYGNEGGVVEISCRRANGFVLISVEDDGRGIPAQFRESIFVMGVRGPKTETSGNGIGLALVRAIAQRAGGNVWVAASRLGGARFVLAFREA
jgi:two-component system, OmpR family, phosphate regulon sensor histidine kinase PhoR